MYNGTNRSLKHVHTKSLCQQSKCEDDLISTLLDLNYLRSKYYGVTTAELEVAKLLCIGKTYKEIARLRNVSSETIKKQVSNVLLKSDCRNKIELISLTIRKNAHYVIDPFLVQNPPNI